MFNCTLNRGANGCFSVTHASAHLANSTINMNFATNPQGCTIIVADESTTDVFMENSVIEENWGGFGTICIADNDGCPNQNSMITIKNTLIQKNDVSRGGVVFYLSPTALPACVSSVKFDESPLSPDQNIGPVHASYPLKMITPSVESLKYPLPQLGEKLVVDFRMQIGDFWSQPVSVDQCRKYLLCLTSMDPKFVAFNATSGVTCSPESNWIDLHFETAAEDVQVATYDVEIKSCPDTLPLTEQPSYIAKIVVSDTKLVTISTPAYVIAIVVVVAVLLIVGAVLFVFLYLRKKKSLYRLRSRAASTKELSKPLLTREGVMMTDLITQALTEAKIPVVDPEEIEIIETVGVGATGGTPIFALFD